MERRPSHLRSGPAQRARLRRPVPVLQPAVLRRLPHRGGDHGVLLPGDDDVPERALPDRRRCTLRQGHRRKQTVCGTPGHRLHQRQPSGTGDAVRGGHHPPSGGHPVPVVLRHGLHAPRLEGKPQHELPERRARPVRGPVLCCPGHQDVPGHQGHLHGRPLEGRQPRGLRRGLPAGEVPAHRQGRLQL